MDFLKDFLTDKKTSEELINIITDATDELNKNLKKENQKVKLEKIKGEFQELKNMINNKETKNEIREIYQKRNESKDSNDFISKESIDIPQQRGGFINLYDKNYK